MKRGFHFLVLLFSGLLVLVAPGYVFALEYLTDEELSKMDGFTSNSMKKEFNDEGEMLFRRTDDVDCQYYQGKGEQTKIKCSSDELLGVDQTLQSYLNGVLFKIRNTEIKNPLDLSVNNRQTIEMELHLKNFDYSKDLMCRNGSHGATLLLQNVTADNGRGGPMIIGPTTSRVDSVLVNGNQRKAIIMNSDGIKGRISIDAIRVGSSEEDALASPSFGGLIVQFPEGMKSNIVIYE